MNCLILLLTFLQSSYGQAALTTAVPCTLSCPIGQICTVSAIGAQQCVNRTSTGCNLLCNAGEQCILTQLGAQCVSIVSGNGQTSVCGPNESLNQCGNLCEQKCQYAGSNGRVCPMVCGPPACACSSGFYRHEQTNKCVPRVMCQSVESGNAFPGLNWPSFLSSFGLPSSGSLYPASNFPGSPFYPGNSNWNQEAVYLGSNVPSPIFPGANYPGNGGQGSNFPGNYPGNINNNPFESSGYPLSYYLGLSGSSSQTAGSRGSPIDGYFGSSYPGNDFQGYDAYNWGGNSYPNSQQEFSGFGKSKK